MMPLSSPVQREPLHRRHIECRGYHRADGKWDIEAHLIDTKAYDFPNAFRGEIRKGEPVHEMWLRITVDDDFLVTDIEAAIDAGPYRICPQITPAYAVLKGQRIAPGWTRLVRKLLGGTKGCTHLVELLGPVATVAFQTILPRRERLAREAQRTVPKGRSRLIDSCHALARDAEVVREHWPEYYAGPR